MAECEREYEAVEVTDKSERSLPGQHAAMSTLPRITVLPFLTRKPEEG